MSRTTRRNRARVALVFGIAAIGVIVVARMAFAVTTADTDGSVAPDFIKKSSDKKALFAVRLTSNCPEPVGCDQIQADGVQLGISVLTGFTVSDTLGAADGVQTPCSGGENVCGIQFWEDTSTSGTNDDSLDAGDTLLSTGFTFNNDCTGGSCTATLDMPAEPLQSDGSLVGSFNYFIALRTSNTIANGDRFRGTLAATAFSTSPSPTVISADQTDPIEADTTAPAAPTVSALGLSTQTGIVRVAGTAVSTETSGKVEVYRSTDGCDVPEFVARSAVRDLTQLNTDLITDPALTPSAFIQGSTFYNVCYRVIDVAENASTLSLDGAIPAQPSATDVTKLAASNVTGLSRIYADTDTSGPRSFRLYIKPGNTGSYVRAGTEAANTFAEIATSSANPVAGTSTDLTQFGGGTLAAGDGVGYARLNANGNTGEVRDDSTIPGIIGATELALLSTSAADGHQRVASGADAAQPQTFGLYADTAGGTAWRRAVSTSGGSTPVRVTTAATATDSGTTSIFSGAVGTTALGAAHAVSYVIVNAAGNESDATADGAIPAVPTAADLKLSDALDTIVSSAVTAGTKIALHAGASGDSAGTAYGDGTAEGEITAADTPVTIAEVAEGQTVYYTTRDTTTGNESAITADGTVPVKPGDPEKLLLSTSAADGHQRIVAAADTSNPRTFRLYGDTGGGTTWVRSSTTSGGTTPVEVTTAATATDTAGPDVFFGATMITSAHSVGYARLDANGNDSDVAADGTIPAAPDPATLSVSDALDQLVATGASATTRFDLYEAASGTSAVNAYDETPTASASSSSPVAITNPATGDVLFYTAVTSATGNESPTIGDGTVPAAPASPADVALLGVSNVVGHERIVAAQDTSSRIFRLYVDPAGGTAFTRALTTSGGSTPVEVTTLTSGGADSGTTTVFSGAAGTTALTDGHKAGYALRDANGNDSDVTEDGLIPTVPATGSVAATAANDTVTSSEGSGTSNILAFLGDGSSTADTAYTAGVDATMADANPVGLDSTAGDKLFYTKRTDLANESDIVADGSIPAVIAASDTIASDANDSFTVPGATATNNVRVFMDSGTCSTAYGNGADFTATSSPFSAGSDLPAQNVCYTVKDTASGNESALTADGTIPASPDGVHGAMSASAAGAFIRATLDSESRTVRLYGDPAGGTAYVRATTTAGGSTPVEVTTSTSGTVQSAPGIFLSGAALTNDASIAYATVETSSGNDSDVVTDGTIPDPPAGAGNFAASAQAGTATIAAGAASGDYRVYADGSQLSNRTTHTNGTPTTANLTGSLAAADAIGYALTDTASNNESPVLSDGTIPSPPAASTTSASARSDTVTATGASATDNVKVFKSTSADPATAYGEGADATLTDATPTALDVSTGDRLYYTGVNTNGNESLVAADGLVPAAPSLPAATTLVAAGDGGTGAAAGTINSIGDNALTLRPGIEVSATGEGVRLYATKGATVSGSALSASGTVTPVFGGTTASVTYGSTNQDSTTGALDVSTLGDGTDVAVTATRLDTGGNESVPSAAVSVIKDTVSPGPATDVDINPDGPNTSDTMPDVSGTVDADTVSVSVFFDATGTANDRTLSEAPVANAFSFTDADYAGTGLADAAYTVRIRAFDVSGNFSEVSPPGSYTIDTAAPAAPALPDLRTADDSGSSSSDNVTSVRKPLIDVTAEAGATVTLLEGATVIDTEVADGAGLATLQPAADLSEAVHTFKARATDAAGNDSADSTSLAVTIDATAPATPGVPDLTAGTDTGTSSTDEITNDTTPTFNVDSDAGTVVTILEGTTELGSASASSTAVVTVTDPNALSDGAHSIKARAVDLAGNVSGESAALAINVDTVAPGAPGTPDLDAASDTGSSSTDDITKDSTPSLTVAGLDAEVNGMVRLFEGATERGSATNSTGAASLSVTSGTLSEGDRTLTAKAYDVAGNASGSSGGFLFTVDTTGPSAGTITGSVFTYRFTVSRSYNVAWGATDTGGSGISTFDVFVRKARYSGSFDALRTWRNDTAATSAAVTGTVGYTYCFRSAATDVAGNVGATGTERCTAIPMDDANLAHSAGWGSTTNAVFYLGTRSHTFTAGRTLSLNGSIAKRISIIVTTCSTCGTVDVYVGSTRLKRVSLFSTSTKHRRFITISASAPSGQVRIVDVVSGKLVGFDGLALSRA